MNTTTIERTDHEERTAQPAATGDVPPTAQCRRRRQRRGPRRLFAGVLAMLTAATAFATTAPDVAEAASPYRQISCTRLAGSGTYSNPYRIGTITQPTIVVGCRPLTSGRGFNTRYFSFDFRRQPSAGSAVMTYYQRRNASESGVHPRISSGPWTVKNSLSARYWRSGSLEGFYHLTRDLRPGQYRVGAEKLRSPLSSLQTASYNILIVP